MWNVGLEAAIIKRVRNSSPHQEEYCMKHKNAFYPKNIMLEFDGNTITAHGLEEYKKYVGKGGCFYSGRFDYELGCKSAIRNMFCQIAAD